ncbi:MAG: hypothetical protein KDC43_07135 [Saprospiraceae bacterium]|nr:hypothetical protein [Saprospiraceae bacterium]MCB0679836.1 hypothetical protein [Saprospiraceae bacterium]
MSLKLSGAKLFSLLSKVDLQEWDALEYFVAGRVSAERFGPLQALLGYCRQWHPDFPAERMRKDDLHRLIYPGKAYREKRIRQLFSDLSGLTEAFFAVQVALQQEEWQERLLLEGLAARKLDSHFLQRSQRRIARRQAEAVQGPEHYRAMYEDLQRQTAHRFVVDYAAAVANADRAQQYFDQWFVLVKLRYYCDWFSRKRFLSGQKELPLFESVWEYLETELRERGFLFDLYYLLLRLLRDDERSLFPEIRDRLWAHQPAMEEADQRIVLQCLLNYCLRMVQQLGGTYVRTSWELYRFGIEKKILIVDGRLTDLTFTNIVVNGADLKEFAWTWEFVERYAGCLDPEVRQTAVALARAYLHYKQDQFDEVVGLLRDVEYMADSYKIRGRSLLLRTYYELFCRQGNYPLELFSHLEAFRRFLQRNRVLTDARKAGYLQLISLLRRMVRLQMREYRGHRAWEKLAAEVQASPGVVAQPWLLEKIAIARGTGSPGK